jgi:ribosomal protein L22
MSAEDETTGSVPPETPEQKSAKGRRLKRPSAKKAAKGAVAAGAEETPVAEATDGAAEAASSEAAAEAPAPRKAPKAKAKAKAAASPAAAEKAGEPSGGKDAEQTAPAAKRAPAPAANAASSGGTPAARRRVVRARARYVRTSARKARMVCVHLRGKSVREARAILAFTPREVARDWSKLLESAVANAESNHELLGDDLIVREAYADEGPTIKRFRPRAMGRATPIRKRTSHLTITLTPGEQRPAKRKKG